MTLLAAEGIVKRFTLEGRELTVLDGVDLTVEPGQIVGIVGSSGAGKSTLLHILGGLDHPTEGSVRFEGEELYHLPEPRLARFRAERIGYVFQQHLLLPEFTAVENVALACMVAGRPRGEATARAEELLRSVGLAERLGHRPGKLSGGEQQRVALARALANGPALVLADEPTGNLDTKTGEEVFDLMLSLRAERGAAFVMVTHNLSLARRMDRVLVIRDGIIVGDPNDMLG